MKHIKYYNFSIYWLLVFLGAFLGSSKAIAGFTYGFLQTTNLASFSRSELGNAKNYLHTGLGFFLGLTINNKVNFELYSDYGVLNGNKLIGSGENGNQHRIGLLTRVQIDQVFFIGLNGGTNFLNLQESPTVEKLPKGQWYGYFYGIQIGPILKLDRAKTLTIGMDISRSHLDPMVKNLNDKINGNYIGLTIYYTISSRS